MKQNHQSVQSKGNCKHHKSLQKEGLQRMHIKGSPRYSKLQLIMRWDCWTEGYATVSNVCLHAVAIYNGIAGGMTLT